MPHLLLATCFLLVGCDDQTAATHEHSTPSAADGDPANVFGEERSDDRHIRLGMAYDHAEALFLNHEAENISSSIGYRVASSLDGVPTFVGKEYFETKDGTVYCLTLNTQPASPIITRIERADSSAKLAIKAETWVSIDSIEL